MGIIIGINAFHPDASACAFSDGKLLAEVGPFCSPITIGPFVTVKQGIHLKG